jgi:glutathione S-transferase
MKLFYNPPSPYARKVLIVAHERGLSKTISFVPIDPWKDPPELLAATPLAKVPALELDDGTVLTESTAICEYLEQVGRLSTRSVSPELLARTKIAQGLIDASFAIVIERRRPPDKQWQEWIERQQRAIDRALPTFSVKQHRFDLVDVTLACGLAYLDFRLSAIRWREGYPQLATWLDEVSRRPSMQASKP